MAVAFVKRILYLITEFFAHADILRNTLDPAGTVSAGSLQPFLYSIHDLLILI